MSDPLVLMIAWAALAVALLAGWFAVPRPPKLEGERWFKAMLDERLRSIGVAEGERRRWVPYHPAGRLIERKLAHPGLAAIDGAPLEGEQALVQAWAALPTVAARHASWVTGGDRTGLAPAALGPEHDPSRWLGPGHGWGRLADGVGAAAVVEAAEARQDARWVWVDGGGSPALAPRAARFATVVPWWWGLQADGFGAALAAWGEALRGLRGAEVMWTSWEAVRQVAERLGEAQVALAADGVRRRLWAAVEGAPASRRLLVGADGVGTTLVLRALVADMDLRDRVVAVLSVGGWIGGLPDLPGPCGEGRCKDWLDAWFRHELLDTEVIRQIPYLSVQWLDGAESPPGAGGLPVGAARFPEPQFVGGRFLQPKEAPTVEVVDLGALSPDPALPLDEVLTALRLVSALWSLSRR